VIVTIVLLKEAWINAIPSTTALRAFFFGAALAAGFAIDIS
jgi:RsiW-degrading membrane proteinase PrsW (M82 family)